MNCVKKRSSDSLGYGFGSRNQHFGTQMLNLSDKNSIFIAL